MPLNTFALWVPSCKITVLDRSPAHMDNGATGFIRRFCGDALALPFADRSFDVVGSALFVHPS